MDPLSSGHSLTSFSCNALDSESDEEELLKLNLNGSDSQHGTLIINDVEDAMEGSFGVDWSEYEDPAYIVIRYKQQPPRKRIPELFNESIYSSKLEEKTSSRPLTPNGRHIYKEMILFEALIPKQTKEKEKGIVGKPIWQALSPDGMFSSVEASSAPVCQEGLFSQEAEHLILENVSQSTASAHLPTENLWKRVARAITQLVKKIISLIQAAVARLKRMIHPDKSKEA